MKLPLQRMPYSGSTSSWIADADGNDIARCSCGRCSKCGDFGCEGNVAFPDKVAQAIVDAVNRTDLSSMTVDELNGEVTAAILIALIHGQAAGATINVAEGKPLPEPLPRLPGEKS